MHNRLDSSADETRRLGTAAAETIAAYYERLKDLPVMTPVSSVDIEALLDRSVPSGGVPFEDLLAFFNDVVIAGSRQNGHPRSLGYVTSPGSAVAAAGEMLAAGLNSNVTSWRSAPAATQLEKLVIDWFKELLGFPAGAAGLLVSGGSMANFAGIAAARSAAEPDIARKGIAATGKRFRVYVSAEGHFSNAKAASMLGIGRENVQSIPTRDDFKIDTEALETRIEQDAAAGYTPMCIVANAGTVASGAVDPIAGLAEIARRRKIWLHVDGAYGGFAALAPTVRPLFEGLHLADSVSLDPHKWLYTPMGCGCVLYRDPEAARRAFSQQADYIRPVGREGDEAFAFWDYGPELSRPFRALPVWMQMKYAGVDYLAASIERNIQCARYFGKLVGECEDFEMMAPVELSIVCFRYAPGGFRGDLNALNERVLIELQRAGGSYLSNANLRGRFCLRGCVLNYRTTAHDMEILLRDVRAAAAAVPC